MNKKYEVLEKYFGYSKFRTGQKELIDAMLSERDALGIMPTGGGKSICYQIPAIIMSGITLVVSPLISLMKDQVMSLKAAGISAAYINSSLSSVQIQKVLENFRYNKYKIVYIAPERLLTDSFLSAVGDVSISMIAIDEAHCISEWGQDFRPSYLKITEFIGMFPYRPVVSAFTATATEVVRKDISQILGLHNPLEIVTGFDRPNLFYDVIKPQKKQAELMELLKHYSGKNGIIYCSTRKNVENIYYSLYDAGYPVTKYHAGLSEEERHMNQDDFVNDRKKIMAATNAFGMGIDKSNVSFVIHYNMPKSLEEYYQEAGRAGRDGSYAECILLYSAGDIQTAKFLIENTNDNSDLSEEERKEYIRHEMLRLNTMIGYCKTTKCFRGYILDYFGQTHGLECSNCGNCHADITDTDITTEAQMILSCIKRIKTQLGYSVGAATVVSVLKASRNKKIKDLSLDKLSTYGLMKSMAKDAIQLIIDALIEQGYISITKFSTLEITEKSNAVLFNDEKVVIRIRKQIKNENSIEKANADNRFNEDLYLRLSELRLLIARREGVPAYIVFSNATLRDMASKVPHTMRQFLTVNGVGKLKAERYGEAFLKEINKITEE